VNFNRYIPYRQPAIPDPMGKTRRRRRETVIFMTTVFCLVTAVLAPAYVLCPEMIIEKMVAALGPSSGYVVTQRISLDDVACDAPGDQATRIEETAWFKPPGKFRSEITVNNIKRAYVSDADGALTLIDRRILSLDKNPLMAYKDLLVFRDRDSLTGRLTRLGLDMSLVSLGRFDGTVAFVIGAKYPDASVSQLWVDKETFLPQRLLIKTEAGSRPLEIRYGDWRKTMRFYHPRRIEIYQDGRIQRLLCARDVRPGGDLPGSLFDVAALRAKYPMIGAEAATDQTDEKNADVQRTIDDFRQLYQ